MGDVDHQLHEAQSKDLVLKFLLENYGKRFSAHGLKRDLLKDNSIEVITLLMEKICDTYDPVVKMVRSGHAGIVIEASDLTRLYIENQGGFTGDYLREKKNTDRKEEIEKLQLKVLILEEHLKNWELNNTWIKNLQNWWWLHLSFGAVMVTFFNILNKFFHWI